MITVIDSTAGTPAIHEGLALGEAAILFALPGETVTVIERRLLREQINAAGSVEFRPGVTFTEFAN
jgi:hypothetical protein